MTTQFLGEELQLVGGGRWSEEVSQEENNRLDAGVTSHVDLDGFDLLVTYQALGKTAETWWPAWLARRCRTKGPATRAVILIVPFCGEKGAGLVIFNGCYRLFVVKASGEGLLHIDLSLYAAVDRYLRAGRDL